MRSRKFCLFWCWITILAATDFTRGQDYAIQRTGTPPVIDGLGDDAVWSNAVVHGFNEFNLVDNAGGPLDGPNDLSAYWLGLWDDNNLYLYVEVTDDTIVTEDSCDWQDDSIEFYIDAQDLNVVDYRPDQVPGIPAYQFTAIAGNNIETYCGSLRIPEDSTSIFTYGINSYNEADDVSQYPQGSDVSVSVIRDENHYTLEVAFPWEALEETPGNIVARGAMGFGVAVNDDDTTGGRDTQAMWATAQTDLWMRSDQFPSVQLVGEVIPPLFIGGQGTIGTRTETGTKENPTYGPPTEGKGLKQEWFSATNPGNKDAIDAIFESQDPIVDPFRAQHGTTWWTGNAAAFGDLVRYPAEVQPPLNGTDNNDYVVRATGEIFIPESGDYQFADGVDDYTYFAIDLDNSGVAGDDPIEILIDDNTWTSPLRDQNGGGGGWNEIEIDVADGGEWLAVEFNMGEAGGGDSGVVYWDYNPNAPEGERLGGGVGFPDIADAITVENAPDLVIPDTHLRSTARGLIAADLVATITTPRVLEFDVNGDTDMADQIIVENPDPEVFTTILDVEGASFQINPLGSIINGDSFQIVVADEIVGMPLITSTIPGQTWTFDALSGSVIFGTGVLRGDFNGNGEIDLGDLDNLTLVSAGNTDPLEYDLTGDGKVDGADVTEWIKAKDIGYSWIGDANFDGQFNTGDFVQVLGIGKYEQPGASAVWSEGDWNGDGVFGTGDLVAALSDGGYEIGPRTDVAAVPEPSSVLLIVVGLWAFVGTVRRR